MEGWALEMLAAGQEAAFAFPGKRWMERLRMQQSLERVRLVSRWVAES
jgi:hypothetical protein